MPRTGSRWQQVIMLVLFSLTVSITLQKWIGDITIYAASREGTRLMMHHAILTNTLPKGVTSWKELGANGTNVRVATVYAVEWIARLTHLPVLFVYRLVDTGCLVLFFPLFFFFLRRWVEDEYALLGITYSAAVLPLTYFLHVFHPWDRPSLLAWLVILMLLVSEHLWMFAVALALSMLIKFDTILIPALYFLIYARRDQRWHALAITAVLFVMTFGIFAGLIAAFPGGGSSYPISYVLHRNAGHFAALGISYPPLLAFLVPAVLAATGFRAADRAAKACVMFAIGMTLVFLLQTNFQEVRAEMSLLLLIMPCALLGLRELLRGGPLSQSHSPGAQRESDASRV